MCVRAMQDALQRALEEAQGRVRALEEEARCGRLDAEQLEATMRDMHTSLQVGYLAPCLHRMPACLGGLLLLPALVALLSWTC